jgi:hypothetical protein
VRDAILRSNFHNLPIKSWVHRELSEKRDLPFNSRFELVNIVSNRRVMKSERRAFS